MTVFCENICLEKRILPRSFYDLKAAKIPR